MAGRPRWRALPTGSARSWDGELVFCSSLTGHTHVLDVLDATVVQALIGDGKTGEEVTALVADYLGVAADEQVRDNVRALLSNLDELGIIGPAGGC